MELEFPEFEETRQHDLDQILELGFYCLQFHATK